MGLAPSATRSPPQPGAPDENGAANYYLIHRSPIDIAENYTQASLGLTLTCARCHNHLMEKWTQVDYYGFANLFARVSREGRRLDVGQERHVDRPLDAGRRQRLHPASRDRRLRRGRSTAAADAARIPTVDRREHSAHWTTSPENTLFARAIVNRVWANYFGRGLVHPMDDLRFTNPASNEPLLASVTADFVSNGFDLRWLMREDHDVGRVSALIARR